MLRIKRIVNLFILPGVVGAFMLLLLINNQRKVPGELVFEQELIDFGEVPDWEGIVTKSIKAQNKGKKKLVIERIENSCGYAKVESPKEIQPGEAANLNVVFNPEIVKSDKPAGSVIFTDSPRTPHVYLTILATVKHFAELSAEVCDFGEIAEGSVHEKKVKLRVNAPMNMDEIRLIKSKSPALRWEMQEGHSDECILKVKLGPLNNKGIFLSVLTVVLPNERTLTLPVVARVVGKVKIRPECLFYGTVAKGDEPSSEFVLESETPFKILQIHVPDILAIDGQSDNENRTRFTVKVRWRSKHAPQILREEIRVMTSAEKDIIRIPAYGVRKMSNKPQAAGKTAGTLHLGGEEGNP